MTSNPVAHFLTWLNAGVSWAAGDTVELEMRVSESDW